MSCVCISFNISYQIRDGNVRSDANKDMNVIRHRVNLNHLLLFVSDDAGNIFVEFIFVFFGDDGLSSLNGKDDVYIELSVGICHLYFSN